MNINYGVAPESFKLIWGDRAKMNFAMVGDYPKEIKLVSGKNDTAAFQILISADELFALNISNQPWFSQQVRRKNIRLSAKMPFEAKLSHVGMHLCDDAFYRGDSLLDKSVVETDAENVLSVYCEMKIPKDAEKGSYNGKILIYENYGFSREELVGELNVTLDVFGFVFPENADNGFHLDLWQHPSNIARQYGVELWSDDHFELLDSYCASLGELGVKSVSVIASEIPWNGQACQNELRYKANLFEYSMIPITRRADGSMDYDFSIMQRYIDLCAKYGVEECISVFGLVNVWDTKEYGGQRTAPDYPDGIHVRYFDEATGSYDYIRTANELDAYIKALECYFNETNQNERVRIAADEPADVVAYRASLEHIKSVAPSFKYKTAINHAEFVSEFGNDIYDFAPYISAMFSEYDALMKFKSEMPGKRFLYYVCCAPEIPNSFIRSELTDGYYTGILAAYAKMDGFLRWNYTVWTDYPNLDIRYGPFPVGDLNFVYPGANGKPLLTLRWKTLFRGIKYFALIKAAEKRGLTEALDKAYDLVLREKDVKSLYCKWDRTTVMSTSADDYRDFATTLMEALEA
ncbi:MAG: DUF4091 domain-containing protein [Clostridia bacterium]|nr:DUF4091 domain-containing protein [Clostridia bacterium]